MTQHIKNAIFLKMQPHIVWVKPTNKASLTRVPTLSIPYSAVSLRTSPDKFYPSKQRLQSRRGLSWGVQGRAVRTKFLIVGEEDMGIWRREIITYVIIIQYQIIAASFMEHHSASNSYKNIYCINLKPIDHIDMVGRDWIISVSCHSNISITTNKNWSILIASYINIVQICHIT